MSLKRTAIVGTFCAILALPALAGGGDHRLGFGFVGGSVDSDDFAGEIEFDGLSIFGKFGFTGNWGLLVSLREMEDDEPFIEDEYEQFAAHAVYTFRIEKLVRPHVKFGIVHTEFEAAPFPGGPLTDDDSSFSFGGGLEIGRGRVAFFGDLDYTEIDFIDIDLEIANTTLGVAFKL